LAQPWERFTETLPPAIANCSKESVLKRLPNAFLVLDFIFSRKTPKSTGGEVIPSRKFGLRSVHISLHTNQNSVKLTIWLYKVKTLEGCRNLNVPTGSQRQFLLWVGRFSDLGHFCETETVRHRKRGIGRPHEKLIGSIREPCLQQAKLSVLTQLGPGWEFSICQ